MSDVVISYKNITIDSLTAPGTKTINSSGKYLEDDITISYTKPSVSWAAIDVTYPSGSTCTATNGTITLTASDTSGSYLFEIPEPSSKPETWTISCTDGIDSTSKTVSISTKWQIENIQLNYISNILNDNSWDVISQVAQTGLGDTYWDLGDAKEITFKSGATIGTLSVSNVTLCVFILSFNHVDNGVADNNILFGGFKSALTNGIDICLVDSKNGSYSSDGTKYFNINHKGSGRSPYNTNYGGWKGCDFRYDILGGTSTPPSDYGSTPSKSRVGYDATTATITTPVADTLMAAIPDDFRAVLRLRTHYLDNNGNGSVVVQNTATEVVDAISLLTAVEVSGSATNATADEANHQTITGYYNAGNSRFRYKYNNLATKTFWWLASSYRANSSSFTSVNTNAGSIVSNTTRYSYGLAPVFKV